MAMKLVGGSFSITALFDGTTLNSQLVSGGAPLLQFFTKNTKVTDNKDQNNTLSVTPDYEKMNDEQKPTLTYEVYDLDSNPKKPASVENSIVWKYNLKVIHFSAKGNKMISDQDFPDMFELIVVLDADKKGFTRLRVLKNLVPYSNWDNDVISASCIIEHNGQYVLMPELSKEVIIQEATGNSYALVLSSSGNIDEDNLTVKLTAKLYKDGYEVTSGVRFRWYKILDTDTEIVNSVEEKLAYAAATQTQLANNQILIKAADVDGLLKVRCDAVDDQTGDKFASESISITDFSDPFYITFAMYDVKNDIKSLTTMGSNILRKGDKVKIIPKLFRRSAEGDEQRNPSSWSITLRQNDGDIIGGLDASTVYVKMDSNNTYKIPGPYVILTYDQIHDNGNGISGYVQAIFN